MLEMILFPLRYIVYIQEKIDEISQFEWFVMGILILHSLIIVDGYKHYADFNGWFYCVSACLISAGYCWTINNKKLW